MRKISVWGIKNHWAAVVRGGGAGCAPLVPLVFTTWQAIPFKRKFYTFSCFFKDVFWTGVLRPNISFRLGSQAWYVMEIVLLVLTGKQPFYDCCLQFCK